MTLPLPERGDVVRFEGDRDNPYTVQLSSDGRPYVIRFSRDYDLGYEGHFEYDTNAMEEKAQALETEAARLRAKVAAVRFRSPL